MTAGPPNTPFSAASPMSSRADPSADNPDAERDATATAREHSTQIRDAFSEDELADSAAACRHLAETHGENFTVVSRLLLPPDRYDDFAAIYAFCRLADDAADEQTSPEAALRELARMQRLLDACGWPDGPGSAIAPVSQLSVDTRRDTATAASLSQSSDSTGFNAITLRESPHFPAIAAVIARRALPREPFADLLDAFVQDQSVNRYETWSRVLNYCERSANPVGRLVLLITGHGPRPDWGELATLSDCTCTALQLTNFWQDIHRDLIERDRIYVPEDVLTEHGLSTGEFADQIRNRTPDQRTDRLVRYLVDQTRPLFDRGRDLWPMVEPDVRPSIVLFTRGGETVLRAVERSRGGVVHTRPAISTGHKGWLLLRAWFASRRVRRQRHRSRTLPPSVNEARD